MRILLSVLLGVATIICGSGYVDAQIIAGGLTKQPGEIWTDFFVNGTFENASTAPWNAAGWRVDSSVGDQRSHNLRRAGSGDARRGLLVTPRVYRPRA